MIDVGGLKKGMIIDMEGELYRVISMNKHFTGRGSGIIRTKLKNVLTGYSKDHSFSSGEKVDEATLEYREAEYLYNDGEHYYFMDTNNFEQFPLDDELVGDAVDFLIDNMKVNLMFYESKPIGINLPTFVILEVVETEPNFKGDTVSGSGKPAKMETGVRINVPMFIKTGEKIKVDTRTGEYIERA